ncbi:E3 ubiquitin-protein ligase TRIM45-like [Antedon mediterranea]|uniref:E3 ubiquitin-protein ligase TRIM45-like n=1 Tax=Antedon mediterranea TaxID=105859 RepID=UPI003AF90BD3
MATSKLNQFLQDVDEDLVCSICQERFQHPKSLQCLHSFCLSCLENWVKTNNGKLTCPMCCTSYPIPDGGLKKLPPNTFLNNMLENIDKFQKKDNIKCVCGTTEQAIHYCKECRHYLCFTCSKQHNKFPMLASHALLAAGEVQSMTPQQLAALNPPLCSSHNKPLELYCTKCKEPICIHCAVTEHQAVDQNHKTIEIVKAFESFKESAQQLKSTAQHYKGKLENGLKELTENSKKLKESKEMSIKDINNQVKQVKQIIQKKGDEMKKKVDTIYENEKKTNDLEMEKLRAITAELDTNVSFLNQSLKSEPATAMMSSEIALNTLKDQMDNSEEIKQNDNGQINFFGNKHEIDLLKQHDIGIVTQINVKVPKHVIQGETIVAKIRKTHQVGPNQLTATWTHATGLIKIGQLVKKDNEYVIRRVYKNPGICTLNVYFNGTPIKQSPFTINIEKKGLVNDFEVDGQPTGLVKCADDCLLISSFTNEIHKYKQSGECISKITLPEGVQVYKMYKMKNDNIAFSDENCIKVCDMNGLLIKSIGEDVLNDPRSIHIDEATNIIYVADGNTQCVLMFDIYSGKELMKIGSQEEVQYGYNDVTLTQTGKVLVTDWENGQIVLYDNEDKSLKVLINEGDEDGNVIEPQGVVVDEDDNIIVSSHHKLQLFSSDGHFIKRIDQKADGINDPEQLCIISSNPRRIAIANYGGSNIKIFNY